MISLNQGIIEILRYAPVGIFLSDRAGNYSFVNECWSAITGLTLDQAIGDGWIEVLHPEDRKSVIADWNTASESRLNFEQEFRFKNGSTGKSIWVICRTIAIPSVGYSESPGFIGTVTDISLQKQSQDALLNANSFLDSVIENIPNMIFMKDAQDLKFMLFNKAGEDLIGTSRQDLIGKSDFDLFPEDQAKCFIEIDRKVLESGKLQYIPEEPIDTKNGRRFLRTKKIPLKSAAGDSQYLLGISEDITAEKKALDELHQSETLFRNMADSSPVLIWMADSSREFTYFNQPWLDYTGTKLEEQTGDAWTSGVHPEDIVYVRAMLESAFESKNSFSMDYRLLRFDREYRWIRSQGAPLLGANSEFDGYIGSCFDITETIQATERMEKAKLAAEESTRSKSLFLANMSHEIRTPMNAIIGMADLLTQTDLEAEQIEFAQTILSSANSLLSVVNDILDYSKIEAKKLEIAPIIFSLPSLLKEVETSFRPHCVKKQIIFNIVNSDRDLNFIKGDETRIRQILNNLLGNAIKFSKIAGHVTIKLSTERSDRDSNFLIFEVKDNGIGISEDQQSSIFYSFTQADSSITRKYGGTGLGLSIVAQLVELMGGKMFLQSEVGKGSIFTVRLPLYECEAVAMQKSTASTVNVDLNNVEVLVVEDNIINQKLTRMVLEKAGCIVRLVETGQAAIDERKKGGVALILMDIQMPGMDGITATKMIREWEGQEALKPTPIVAMTAHAMQGDKEKFLAAGMDDYVSKPFDRLLLLQKIAELVK
jgi:PAS domain S-box-containing protein